MPLGEHNIVGESVIGVHSEFNTFEGDLDDFLEILGQLLQIEVVVFGVQKQCEIVGVSEMLLSTS